ncbi:MAG: TIGR00730 family Rossman fold protein [Alphaproteobacteria bacterium]|nr:TIGR00730 family Rossman fold protein [Alphaproteobacteria bacterium]
MPGIQSVTVYCGSSNTVDASYLDLARRLGKAIAARKWRLVYGGGNVGLMGQVASSAHEAGGKVLGVMPKFLQHIEGTFGAVEHRFVDTMHERKQILFDEADAFIVLPGGIGTLEEAIETLSWAKLSLHRKPMAFLSENGYWAPFFDLIDHVIEDNFAPASFRDLIAESRSPEEALDALVQRAMVMD